MESDLLIMPLLKKKQIPATHQEIALQYQMCPFCLSNGHLTVVPPKLRYELAWEVSYGNVIHVTGLFLSVICLGLVLA